MFEILLYGSILGGIAAAHFAGDLAEKGDDVSKTKKTMMIIGTGPVVGMFGLIYKGIDCFVRQSETHPGMLKYRRYGEEKLKVK